MDCDCACTVIKRAKAHDGGIVAVAVDTAHDTLIIAEEED